MHHAIKKEPDRLKFIHGPGAAKHQAEVAELSDGRLPPGWIWVASSRSAVVATIEQTRAVFYKKFLPRNRLEGFKAIWRGSRAERARRQAEVLVERGFSAPASLCWGQGRKHEFLVMAGIQGSGLYAYLAAHFQKPLSAARRRTKRTLLAEVGAVVGRLHRAGVVHGDLRPNNLLIEEVEEGRRRYHFIDNERNRCCSGRPPLRLLIENLVQICMIPDGLLSRSDYLRLYRAYVAEYPGLVGCRPEKRLIREVYERSQTRLREIMRRRKVRG